MENSDFVLELLQEKGLLTPEQVEAGWQEVGNSNGQDDIIEVLKKQGAVSDKQILTMLAEQYGMEVVDLVGIQFPQELLDLVPADVARQYTIMPYGLHDDVLTIVMSDPTDMETLDAVRYRLQMYIDAVVAEKMQILSAIDECYGAVAPVNQGETGAASGTDDVVSQIEKNMQNSGGAAHGDVVAADDAPIIKLVSSIIIDAYKLNASDIHLEPMEKRFRVRYRIDGTLREMPGPPKYLQPNVISRLKIMAHMDITEKRIPLDGRILLKMPEKEIDLRVSSIPTTFGESIVMRILDKASIQLDIPKLGFYADDQQKINRIINYPDGVFLVTGPTGSGKTTSLYAFLNTINNPTRKIITVEDPVEYMLPGINQVQVNVQAKMTFAAALKAMLRQAPNIIMVGEIRDLETAEIAINAAMTGHLVFSTLHTNDAPSTVTRLIDMGVQPFLVASAVRAIMAQRLLRRVCKNCAEPVEATADEIRMLGLDDQFLKTAKLMRGKGCEKCNHSGYKGRIGIYEVFMLEEQIQELIYKKCSATVVRDAARKAGMKTLREDALRKAASGITTLSEVIAVTMGDET